MINLFYFLLIIPIILEIWKYNNTNEVETLVNKVNNGRELTPVEKWHVNLNFIYFALTFIGLFTDQWVCFALIFLMSIIGWSLKSILVYKIDAILSMLILIFSIVNHYHLNIVISG